MNRSHSLTRRSWFLPIGLALLALVISPACSAQGADEAEPNKADSAQSNKADAKAEANQAAKAQPDKKAQPSWPQFRGPNGDGSVPALPDKLPETLEPLWKAPMTGMVYSGVAVADGKVVVMDHVSDEKDMVVCLDMEKGTKLWTAEYPNVGDEMDWGSTPRGTPAIHDGKVFAVGARGQLVAVDLAKGEILWQQDMPEKYEAYTPTWGYCWSPIVADGKLLVIPGGEDLCHLALNPKNGEKIWAGKGYESNYASPSIYKHGDKTAVLLYDADNVYARNLADGKVIWQHELPMNSGYVVPTPVVVNDVAVLASEGGAVGMNIKGKTGEIEDDWPMENWDFIIGDASPAVCEGLVLGTSEEGGLMGLSPADDLETAWTYSEDSDLKSFSNMIVAPGKALILTASGNLHLMAITKEGAKSLGKVKVAGSTMAAPALVGDKLFVRDNNSVTCYKLPMPTK